MPFASDQSRQSGLSEQSDLPIFYKWSDIDKAVDLLHDQIKDSGYKPLTIVGVSRGGLIPAVMLAHLLDVHDVQSVRFQRYEVQHMDPQVRLFNNPTTLIVDDIYDKGVTHKDLLVRYPRCLYATLFHKEKVGSLDFPGSLVPRVWISFPWALGTDDLLEQEIPF